ncbi:MAG: WYL domain-containing protein [Anaerohalosphaeraceae bacterium]|nr:WYL domain-containing protein [Anaerohalosphaeraceae bacterium]
MKQSRVSRVVKILTTLQSGQKYAPSDLEKILGVSRRTIFRDLKELAIIGVPYKYDTKDGGYSVDPAFFLPPLDLNLQEALSLLMLIHKMRNHLPLPFKNSALLAGLKVENNLPAHLRAFCQTALKQTTIAADKHATMNLLDQKFAAIQKAIQKKQVLQIGYGSLFEKKEIETAIHPYHLLYKNRAWYVIGFSAMHKSTRTFNLGRLRKIKPSGKCFTDGDDFDVYEYLGKAWSIIPEGRIYNIHLRFYPMVAQNVAEVQWHSTQQADWNEDGSVDLRFRVDGIGEIAWWILGYGDQVEILSPAALRTKVVERANRMVEIHRKS